METTVKKYFIEDKDEFLKLRASWKNFVNNGGCPTAAQMIIYNVIRSKSPLRGFTKATNPGHIGAKQYGEWDGFLQPMEQIERITKWDHRKNEGIKLLEPFKIEEEKCIELLKRVVGVARSVSLPE
jgi:hypothetical protein